MPAMHPDVKNLLDPIEASGRLPYQAYPPAEARASYDAGRAAVLPPLDPVAHREDLAAPGQGGPIPMRLYRSAGSQPDAILPCLLYLHGGGWVLGDLDSHEAICRRLANASGGAVVAVHYRRAPEHPFPATLDDSAAALTYIAEHASALRIDRSRLAVGGDSAGGNLAAVLALMGRDGELPRPVFQMLLYPVVDLSMNSPGYRRVTSGVPLTDATMRYFIDHYTPNPADRSDWRASPLLASDLTNLPPALVVTCSHDPLCEEGRAYARKLDDAGVAVTELHFNDQLHGFLAMGGAIDVVTPALDFAAAVMRDRW